MAHVLTFYRLPDEESRFLNYLAKTGDVMACINEWVAEPRQLEPRPISVLINTEHATRLLFGPREFMDVAPIETLEREGRTLHGRNYSSGPLMAYTRGIFREQDQLGHTNLVFESTILTFTDADQRDFVVTPQPPEFIAWAKRVLSWARRDAPRVVEHKRMTERVFAELAHGLELVP